MGALLVSAGTPVLADPSQKEPAASARADGFSASRLQRMHRFMAESTAEGGYTGAVALVMRNGEIVAFDAYGYRDLARRQPMRKDSIFRIYSMTKTVTSVAVLTLLEEGKLSLDDPIAKFLPEYSQIRVAGADHLGGAAAAVPITIRHLLTHTAGFSSGPAVVGATRQGLDWADPGEATDLRGFSLGLGATMLAAEPGTRFDYNGASLEVLARLVEVCAGMPFADYLQQRIFRPLGMSDTGFTVPAAQRHRVVDLTRMDDDGRLVLADGISARYPGEQLTAYTSGAGGLYSTAADYARFGQMLLAGGSLDGASVLGRKTVELMLRNHLTMLDPPVTQFSDAEGFGLGGYVVIDVAKRGHLGSPGQFGWSGAASTSYSIDPTEQLLMILMLQHLPREDDGEDLPRISRKFYDLVYQALSP
ncbi:MAG: serine hydrolase domain-containing protein [Lysobacter sp.]